MNIMKMFLMFPFPFISSSLSALNAGFSSSTVCLQLATHPLYPGIDWTRVSQGEYAVVDPNDPHSILYLDATDYIVQTRVSMTSRKKLIVLATPQDKAPDPDSPSSTSSNFKKSPRMEGEDSEMDGRSYKYSYKSWFKNPFSWMSRPKVPIDGSVGKSRLSSMILISEGNLWGVMRAWALSVHTRLQGNGGQEKSKHEVFLYVQTIKPIFRGRGINYLITYLKVSMFVVNTYLGGTKLKNTWNLGIGIKLVNGLPASLPLGVRRAIRARSYSKIRLWVSIFYMYKAFWGRHLRPDLGTISAPPYVEGPFLSDFTMWVNVSLKPFLEFNQGVNVVPDLTVKKPFLSIKSGPNFVLSLFGAFYDTLAWSFKYGPYIGQPAHNELVEYLEVTGNKVILKRLQALDAWCRKVWYFFHYYGEGYNSEDPTKHREYYTSNPSVLSAGLKVISDFTGIVKPAIDRLIFKKYPSVDASHMVEYFGLFSRINSSLHKAFTTALQWDEGVAFGLVATIASKVVHRFNGVYHNLSLGKLSLILEPAGKVRVIAILDWWTQTCLIPMHEWLFDTLKKGFGETDATFDQEGAVKHFASQGYKDLYSFDLKSATDLIPQQLYVAVLSALLSKEIAKAWLKLLTFREFNNPYWSSKGKDGKPVMAPIRVKGKTLSRYTRGQPMGALSSWGALALVHHAIVRYSAFLCGHQHYLKYLVLGDDVVIEGTDVANKYREVCGNLGISLSLPKSYLSSEGLFNFASQTMLADTNISPLSFKKDLAMVDGFSRLTSLLSAVPRGLVDFSSASWLQQIARFVLPRTVYSAMEAKRLQGVRHPVIRVLGALLCGNTFEGRGPLFESLAENRVTLPIRLLIQPGLALFSLKLSELVPRDKRTEFTILAHKLLDRCRELITIRFTIAREAFLKDLGKLFFMVDGSSPFDSEGDVRPDTLIDYGALLQVVFHPGKSAMLQIGKLKNLMRGNTLRILCIPFLAAFSDYLIERLSLLYNEARLSKKARDRDKLLQGEWWKKGFKMSFGVEPAVQQVKDMTRGLQTLQVSPKIVLDLHDTEVGEVSDSVLDYLHIGLMTDRSASSGFTLDELVSLDPSYLPENTNVLRGPSGSQDMTSP